MWAAGYWGAVLVSDDGGRSWSRGRTPTRRTLFDVDFADARHGWAVGEEGVLLRSRDGGRTWQAQRASRIDPYEGRVDLDVHLFGVAAVSPREAWVVGDLGAVARTRDGETWEPVGLPEAVFGDEEVPDRIFNAVEFSGRQHGWIVGEFGTALRTTDAGTTWSGERDLSGAAADLYLFDVSALGPERVAAVGLAGHVLVSDDGGVRWQASRLPTSAALYGLAWGAGGPVVVGDRGELYVDTEEDAWAAARRPRLFNWLRDAAEGPDGRLFAVGEQGLVLRSEDDGRSWEQLHGREPPPFAAVQVPQPGPGTGLQSPEVQLVEPSAGEEGAAPAGVRP